MAENAPPPPPPPFLPPDEEIREELYGQQVKIHAVLFSSFLVFALILTLGRLRSRGNSVMKFVCTNSFLLTTHLVSYMPGLLNSSAADANDLYIFWTVLMPYLTAVANEVSCYTLGDNEGHKSRLIPDYTVVWPLILIPLHKDLVSPEILVPILLIFWICFLKLRERNCALKYATNSNDGFSQATQIISDFSDYRKQHPTTTTTTNNNNNNNNNNDNILIGIREAKRTVDKQLKKGLTVNELAPSEFITLHSVMATNPETLFLVSSKVGKELQDTCTSFAMFWTLLAKIAGGFVNVNAKILGGNNKVLPKNSFALVEKELDFLYDYLFTNYYAIYERGIWRKLRDLFVATLFFWLTLPLLFQYSSPDHTVVYVLLWGCVLDTGFTRFVILSIITIEYAQIGVFLTSKWAKVMYICSYLTNQIPSSRGTNKSRSSAKTSILITRLITLAFFIPRPRLSFFCLATFTKRKLGQYSIMSCYARIPSTLWLHCWLGAYYELPRFGQSGSSYIDLTPRIQDSILNAINNCIMSDERNGVFSSGVYSLKENQVEEDIVKTYVRDVPNQARIILIWHIATSELEGDDIANSVEHDDFQLATTFSKYCAYLLAFLPQMLPDHRHTTKREFDEAIKELKIEMLEFDEENPGPNTRLNTNNVDKSVYKQGKELKEKLAQQQNLKLSLWRTLAEFWTEMLLFLAVSDNGEGIEEHANTLCVGGEFITHLWALLIHAGCSGEPII